MSMKLRKISSALLATTMLITGCSVASNGNTQNEYKIEECLDMTKDINIVYGPPQTGKTSLAKHLKTKYNFELLDFKELIEKVKKTKVDPENPDAEPEINFQDLVQGLKNYLSNLPQKKKIIIDNIFIPGGADGFLIDTVEKAIEVLNLIGNFQINQILLVII